MAALKSKKLWKTDTKMSDNQRRTAIEPLLQAVCNSAAIESMPERFQEDCAGLLTVPSFLQTIITRILESVDSSEARGSYRTSPRHIINHKKKICGSSCPGFDVKGMSAGSMCRVVMYSIHDKMGRFGKNRVDKARATVEVRDACAALNIRISTSVTLGTICKDIVSANFDRLVRAVQMHRGRRQALLGMCKGYK
jgi:hypothetical protein